MPLSIWHGGETAPNSSDDNCATPGNGCNISARLILSANLVIQTLILIPALQAADTWTWWVDPCTGQAVNSGCNQNDEELARWAFEAWQRESGNRIVFAKSPNRDHARLTVHWSTGDELYGETRPVIGGLEKGAPEIYILPGANATRVTDPLLRDTIVFLTFVHETGHALGLSHTANFVDIMYSFQYGGDISAYFDRYRRFLTKRSDIAQHSGLSDGDRQGTCAALARENNPSLALQMLLE